MNPTPYGSYYYSGNPSDWGNPYGAAIESDAPLATVESGRTYTISMSANTNVSPVVLDLLANGVILTPSSSPAPIADPLMEGWFVHTKTYAAASLVGVVGEPLKIRVGWAVGANGPDQGHLDNVQLNFVNVTPLSTACDITAFGPGAVIDQGAKTITMYVPFGTTPAQVAALKPTYTLSPGATCNQTNGAVPTPPLSTTSPVTYKVTAQDTVTTKDYAVTVTVLPHETTLTWNVAGSGNWDTSTFNWLGQSSGLSMSFFDGVAVVFDMGPPTAGSTITVSPNMAPGSTTVSAASGTYTFTGGAIAGSGTLTKSGDGTLVLSAVNTYTGKTIVQAGTLSLGMPLTSAGVAGPLGAPTGANTTIDLHSGTTFEVTVPGLSNPTSDRAFNLAGIDPGTVSIKVNGADTSCTFGAVTATGKGAKTLALYPGAQGIGGDRESLVFKGAISDSSDSSPTSLEVTFNSQTAAASFVNLSGTNTFTGPITLVKQPVVLTGYLVIGGVRTALVNTPGSGTLGNGNYPGTIALDLDTILEYDSSAAQILSGAITPGANGSGALTKTGSGLLTLAGKNTYTGNTTVSAGTLVLANTGGLSFVVTDTSNSKITGGGAATLNGSFTIDTTAVSVPLGSWHLVDVATKTFGATFSVTGFTGPDANHVWKLVNGNQTWTFDQTTGKLNLSGPAMIAAFNIPGVAGVIDQNALTIALTAPYGTSLATLAPTFTLSSGTCNQTSGSPPSPTFAVANPATYTVTDGATVNHYPVTVTVTPVSTAKDILTFGLPGNAGVINGANIVLTLPYGTDVTALAPTYTVSPLATQDASFPSGTPRNFTTPQIYTITAQDGSTKAYTVTVRAGSSTEALIGHWISGPANLSDTSGFTSAGTHDGVAVGANAGLLAWSSDVPAGFTGQSLNLSATNVAVLITNTATTDANYQTTFDEGIATRFTAAFWFKGTLAGTWVGKSGNTPQGWKTRPLSPKADFTMRNNGLGETGVASSMTSSNSVNDGNWHHIAAVFEGRASYRQLYVDGVLQAQVTGTNYAVTFNNLSHLVVGANQGNLANDTISSFFPGLLYDVRMYNYPLSAAEVANLHSPGLIGHWFSGAADLTDRSGFTSPGTHDGVAVGTNAALLAWSSDVPAGFSGQSLDLSANLSDKNVAVMITNTATTDANYKTTFDEGISNKFTAAFWFKGTVEGTWVSKSGNTPWGWKTRLYSPKADFTMRSNSGETVASAMQSANDVNDGNWHHMAAVFDGRASFRQVYVDGVLQARTTGTPYRVNFNNLSHLMVGATQNNGANDIFTTWPFFSGLMYDVRMYGYPLSAAEVDSVYSRRPILTGITGPGPAGFTLQGSTAYAGNLVTWKATNLSPPNWTPVQTNTVPIGTFSITIPLGADPKAFYQLMVP
ncbi:MAG: autotransporter-associated beta strand repeat-containing protein [Verrucomicrobia bacterium]|nr:autotransporter-associated beta strand repeat-containing protein [Verrucomicrobiota bacterium]